MMKEWRSGDRIIWRYPCGYVLEDVWLTVKAVTLIFISGRGSVISSTTTRGPLMTPKWQNLV